MSAPWPQTDAPYSNSIADNECYIHVCTRTVYTLNVRRCTCKHTHMPGVNALPPPPPLTPDTAAGDFSDVKIIISDAGDAIDVIWRRHIRHVVWSNVWAPQVSSERAEAGNICVPWAPPPQTSGPDKSFPVVCPRLFPCFRSFGRDLALFTFWAYEFLVKKFVK